MVFCFQLRASSAVAETTNILEYKDGIPSGRQIEIQANPRGATVYLSPDYKPTSQIRPPVQNRPDSHKQFSIDDRDEPAWTLKIPKGRYPCICDPIPLEANEKAMRERAQFPSYLLSPWNETEIVIQAQIERVMYSKLKTFIEDQFRKSKPLSCEIKYELTKDKAIRNIQIVRPSSDPEFTAAVLKVANSLGSSFVAAPFEFRNNSIQLQSIFTPDGVYPGFSRKLFMRNVSTPDPKIDKLFE
ncbi:MAG: hypothetical protein IT342_01955 [Candidatus Melainabacteria bacterium]|nr:hypothetical protein [Candidatus Melainabacteria bacterium]